MPGDYDGDGHADVAVFRADTGAWWIKYSATDVTTYAMVGFGGGPSDTPVPGDYNRDGRDDPAYYRPGEALFAASVNRVDLMGTAVTDR